MIPGNDAAYRFAQDIGLMVDLSERFVIFRVIVPFAHHKLKYMLLLYNDLLFMIYRCREI
jgi:hypothetical protein